MLVPLYHRNLYGKGAQPRGCVIFRTRCRMQAHREMPGDGPGQLLTSGRALAYLGAEGSVPRAPTPTPKALRVGEGVKLTSGQSSQCV